MFFNELPNNTSQQLPLILVGFGFTPAQSALFNIAKPLWGSFLIIVSAAMLYHTELGVGYTCAISYIPCFVGGIIMVRKYIYLLKTPKANHLAGCCAVVEQNCSRCGNTNLDLQAFISIRFGVGGNYDYWTH